MRIYEDNCVGCPPHMGCLGSCCPNRNVEVVYCDYCESDEAEYTIEIDGKEKDVCEECLRDILMHLLEEEKVKDLCDFLGIPIWKVKRHG